MGHAPKPAYLSCTLLSLTGLAHLQVNEEPGTYFWHGHSGMEKVDSFFGPLIVRPAGPEPLRYDEERVLLLTDNYHQESAPLTFGLNR